MNKIIRQVACDYAGDRQLGYGHGYPSSTADLLEKGFIEGATSEASKKYWYKQFQKEKLEFAIEQIKKIYKTFMSLSEYFADRQKFEINNKIQELEQKLKKIENEQ